MSKEKEIKINIMKLALAVQLAVFGLIGLEIVGLELSILSILRKAVIFAYLTFIPGLVILRILNINTNLTRTILISSGTSLSFVVFISLLGNAFLPFLGIEKPFSEAPLTVLFGVVILLLTGICKWKGNPLISFSLPEHLSFISVSFFLFFLILSLLGAILLRDTGNNFILLPLLFIISILPLLLLTLSIRKEIYPLIIWITSLSLVIHTNLCYGGKSLYETVGPMPVMLAGRWDPQFPYAHNSLLTTAVLHPVFSILTGISIIWETHICAWLIFSFVPLAVYEIHSKFFNYRIAMLSSFLYMFMPFFYTQELIMYAQRTAFAVYFMSILLLVTFNDDLTERSKRILLPFFLFSIATSHYGAAYFFLFTLTIAIFLLVIVKARKQIFSFNTYALYSTILFFWYIYTSSSENLNWVVGFGRDIWVHLLEFLQPEESPILNTILSSYSLSINITKYLNLVIVALTFIGAVGVGLPKLLMNRAMPNYVNECLAISISSTFILPPQILPHAMGGNRLFSVVLLFASPFAVIAFLKILEMFRLHEKTILKIFSLFLCIFLLFGTGLVSNIINTISGDTIDYSINRQIDRLNIQEGTGNGKWLLYWVYRYDSTIMASDWLTRYASDKKVWVDWPIRAHFIVPEGSTASASHYYNKSYNDTIIFKDKRMPNLGDIYYILKRESNIDKGDYIFLAHHNTVEDAIIITNGDRILKTSDYSSLFINVSRIYDNAYDIVYIY